MYMSRSVTWLVLGGVVTGVLLGMNSCTVVDTGNVGVVTNLGKLQRDYLNEGFHFRMPFVSKIINIPVNTATTEIVANSASVDLQVVLATISMNWRVRAEDAPEIYQQYKSVESLETSIINKFINDYTKAAIAKYKVDDILLYREKVKQEISNNLTKELFNYGINVLNVNVVNIDFSPEYKEAIEKKQVASQKQQQATLEAQGLVAKAKGEAEAQRLRQTSLTPQLLQQQALDKWDGKLPTIMTGSNSVPFINVNQTQQEK